MSVRTYLFDADGTDREVELTSRATERLGEQQLLWVDVVGQEPTELAQVGAVLHLHRESVRNLLNPIGRPRLDNFGEYFQVNVVAVQAAHEQYEPLTLDLFTGHNYVVTVHPERIEYLERFAEHIRGDTQIGQLTSTAFLAALLDWHVTSYFRALEDLEEEVERLDGAALRLRAGRRFLVELATLRQRIAELRHLLTPHREVFAALARPDFQAIAGTEAAAHFRALNDRLDRAIDAVEIGREMVIGSFELFMTGTAQSTNDTMRVLTVVTLLVGVAGVIAGVMGMNFQLALFDSGWAGFLGVVAGMVAVIGGIAALARARGWL